MGADTKDVNRLYEAVVNYIEKNGGKVFVIGGIQVQESPFDGMLAFRIAIKFTGQMPAVGGDSDNAPERDAETRPSWRQGSLAS